jgi:phosphatidylserine decarboxylase
VSERKVPLRWTMLLHLLRRLPQGALSRAWGRFAELRWPGPLQGVVNRSFARAVGADPAEAESPPEAYASLSRYFVRRLRPGLRRWPDHPGMPGSPVDGILASHGALEAGTALQAKGISYPVADLLDGEGPPEGFRTGVYFTIYLSPRHYHRIHAPIAGRLHCARAIPGRLLPVNGPAVHAIPDLFPRNERLVAWLDGGERAVALVAVGAYNVGRITAEFDPGWNGRDGSGVTNRKDRSAGETRSYDPPIPIQRGQELMAFHMGSTVVLLLDGPGLRPHPDLAEGMEIRLGTPLLAEPGPV